MLSQLPEVYGYALVWRYWEKRSVREISAETGRTEKAGEPAPARLKSRIYSRLLAEQAATGRLLGVSETQQSGRSLCVLKLPCRMPRCPSA